MQKENFCNLRVLDISCGQGEYLSRLSELWPNNEYYGLDSNTKTLNQASAKFDNIKFITGKAEQLPFQNNSFDTIFCQMAFHHYKNPSVVLAEVARVLRFGGKFYLQDFMPKYKWSRWLNNLCGCSEPYHFEKYYLKNELIEMAEKVDLKFQSAQKISFVLGQNRLLFFKN